MTPKGATEQKITSLQMIDHYLSSINNSSFLKEVFYQVKPLYLEFVHARLSEES